METNIEFMNPFFANPSISGKSTKNEDKIEELPVFPSSSKLSSLPKNPVVTMAYVPMQELGVIYEDEKGLNQGTVFPELDKPWEGRVNL